MYSVSSVPMRLPGHFGERGRDGQHSGAALGHIPVECGKAQVITYGKPERAPGRWGQHGFLARRNRCGFLDDRIFVEPDIEHVDLVVANEDLSGRIDVVAAIVDAAVRGGYA